MLVKFPMTLHVADVKLILIVWSDMAFLDTFVAHVDTCPSFAWLWKDVKVIVKVIKRLSVNASVSLAYTPSKEGVFRYVFS